MSEVEKRNLHKMTKLAYRMTVVEWRCLITELTTSHCETLNVELRTAKIKCTLESEKEEVEFRIVKLQLESEKEEVEFGIVKLQRRIVKL